MDTEFLALREEVFLIIARNMLHYQHLEKMLKALVSAGQFSGFASEVQAKLAYQTEAVQKHTLGKLVGQFFENSLLPYQEPPELTQEILEPFFRFTYTIEGEEGFYKARKASLEQIVIHRNDLIHHLLPELAIESIESWQAVKKSLESQQAAVKAEIEVIQGFIQSFQEATQIHAAFLKSEECERTMELLWLQGSPIVENLKELSASACREDGWTTFSKAGQLLRDKMREEMDQIKARYGCQNLTELIQKSELFDVLEEPGINGGIRKLYRHK